MPPKSTNQIEQMFSVKGKFTEERKAFSLKIWRWETFLVPWKKNFFFIINPNKSFYFQKKQLFSRIISEKKTVHKNDTIDARCVSSGNHAIAIIAYDL